MKHAAPRRVCRPLTVWGVVWGLTLAFMAWHTSFDDEAGTPAEAVADPCARPRLRGAPQPAQFEPLNAADASALTHLVLVAGHSVLTTEALDCASRDDSWMLLGYQEHLGLPRAFLAHVQRGVSLAAGDPGALLVFSGGQTRGAAGPRSEAASYWALAEHAGFWGHHEVRRRAVLEEAARDSFENLLFSLCRFRQFTGGWPARVTVVSLAGKRERFELAHRAALQWPASAFEFVGLDPPGVDMSGFEAGEQAVLAQFREDPFGCASPELLRKREARDPFRRGHAYAAACPALAPMMCSGGAVGELPWGGRQQ